MSSISNNRSPATRVEIRELFAFRLFLAFYTQDPEVADNTEHAAAVWRANPETIRKEWVLKADAIMTLLEDNGLSLRASNSLKVARDLNALMTEPARKAYTLEEEPPPPTIVPKAPTVLGKK